MNVGGTPTWKTLRILGPGARELAGAERLAALEAVTSDELFRLRTLLLGAPPTAQTPSPVPRT